MSVLTPLPPSLILLRALRQREREGKVLDLPESGFYVGAGDRDLSVTFHGGRASTPVGPAAGPHTQLAPNILLAWLGGARILELKTVQVLDRLEIPRPCIDMQTVGFNVEWSQELLVHESAHEYAKAKVLVAALREAGIPEGLPENEGDTLFDVSIGYDLAGIRSAKMTRFLRTMKDASAEIDAVRRELRSNLPPSLRHLADVPVESGIGDCVTLSTFHGCPPGEIEAIGVHLMEEMGFHVVIKMNPTLLGYDEVTEIVRGDLGYDELRAPRSAFDRDPTFDEGLDLIGRLRETGRKSGLTVGAKFTNTLVVENHKGFFGDREMYLSGAPLHVIAMELSARFRERAGADMPVSFSAGIDAKNYAAAVAAGFIPVTACTDLLRPGGYGRLRAYHDALIAAMEEAGAGTVSEFIRKIDDPGAAGGGTESEVREASLRNHRRGADEARRDPRYGAPSNRRGPKKIGSRLALFDCVNCDKCVPVCPNDANFTYETERREVRYRNLVVRRGSLVPEERENTFRVGGGKRPTHQIGNVADLCNDCGNCDVFCPEEGGPYVEKPRFFLSRDSFDRDRGPGFFVERSAAALRLFARREGRTVELLVDGETALYVDGPAELVFAGDDTVPRETRLAGEAAEGAVADIGFYLALRSLLSGVLAKEAASFVSVALEQEP
ncbi:MAG: 4Fe-4S dicluster domain-containing protein [Candidatus Eisenbacteria bacterium]